MGTVDSVKKGNTMKYDTPFGNLEEQAKMLGRIDGLIDRLEDAGIEHVGETPLGLGDGSGLAIDLDVLVGVESFMVGELVDVVVENETTDYQKIENYANYTVL